MSHPRSPNALVPQGALKRGRVRSLRRLSARVGLGLGVLGLAIALLLWVFGGAILNGYGKRRMERALAQALPGCALRIGGLDYSMGANRLVAHSVTLQSTNATLQIARTSLTGVHWARLLWGTVPLGDLLAQATLDATGIEVEFPQALYSLRCARLRASVPGSELLAEGTELHPLVGDEEFFTAHAFRVTRFHVVAQECKVSGLAFGELLEGKSYRAKSVHVSRASFEALVNRDKPEEPFVKPPLMVQEALGMIRRPLQLDNLSITDGLLTYSERVVTGAAPGVLTFGAVSMDVAGIANRGDASAAIQLHAQGKFMNAGMLKVVMTIPVTASDFTLHYSGSLSAMDLTRLNEFLVIAEHLRLKSGSAQEVTFDIHVAAGQARGRVRAIYKDLVVAILDPTTGTEKGFSNRLASFLANALKIRNANVPDASGLMKEGQVNYTRQPGDEFVEYIWTALRGGVLDVVSH